VVLVSRNTPALGFQATFDNCTPESRSAELLSILLPPLLAVEATPLTRELGPASSLAALPTGAGVAPGLPYTFGDDHDGGVDRDKVGATQSDNIDEVFVCKRARPATAWGFFSGACTIHDSLRASSQFVWVNHVNLMSPPHVHAERSRAPTAAAEMDARQRGDVTIQGDKHRPVDVRALGFKYAHLSDALQICFGLGLHVVVVLVVGGPLV